MHLKSHILSILYAQLVHLNPKTIESRAQGSLLFALKATFQLVFIQTTKMQPFYTVLYLYIFKHPMVYLDNILNLFQSTTCRRVF